MMLSEDDKSFITLKLAQLVDIMLVLGRANLGDDKKKLKQDFNAAFRDLLGDILADLPEDHPIKN